MTQFACTVNEWASLTVPKISPKEIVEKVEATRRLLQTRGGFAFPGGPAYDASASVLLKVWPWNEPDYQRSDLRQEKAKKKPPGVRTPPQLKERPGDHTPMHEKPALEREISALQGAGTGQQDKEVLMDQSDSHATLSTVGSSGRSSHSGTTQGGRTEVELEALQNYPYESETPSEQDDRQAKEARYIGSPESLSGDD